MKPTYSLARKCLQWLTAGTLLLLWAASCQRELGDFDPTQGKGGNLDSLGGYGIMFRLKDSANIKGCIDTAEIVSSGTLKVLNISASDTSGKYDYVLNVFTNSGTNFTPGTYYANQGRASITLQADTVTYISAATVGDFIITLVSVTDTLITGTFSGNLVNLVNQSQSINITQGAFKAYLGRPNPCPAPPLPPAVYTITAGTSGDCANFTVNGNYFKDSTLGTTHTLSMEVDVTTPGAYNISYGPVSGYRFAGTGAFSSTGIQTIQLQATGKPTRVGTDTFNVSLGQTTCKFLVTVGPPQITAPCSPANNSATFQGQTINFDSVVITKDSVTYIVTGKALGGQLALSFRDSTLPVQGLYTIVPQATTPMVSGQVKARITVGTTVFTASQGSVYVLGIGTGRVSATICNVNFSGSFGGQTVSGLGTAKMSSP